MKYIAHRGACLEATEDTLEALERGAAYGAFAVECDPRPTKDGVRVIFHDWNLRRLAGDDRNVSDLTLDEMRASLARVGIELTTFDDVIRKYRGRSAVLFDISYDASFDEELFKTLRDAPFRVIAGIHKVKEAELAARYLPRENILAFLPGPEEAEAFHAAGCGILRLWEQWLDTVTPADIRARVGECEVWIMSCDVNNRHPLFCMNGSPASVARVKALGADGILLNDIRMASML